MGMELLDLYIYIKNQISLMIMKGKARQIVHMHISFTVLYIIALEDM